LTRFFFSCCFLLEFFFFTKTLLTLAQHQSIKNSQQQRTGFRKQFLVQILLTRAECVTMYPYNIGLPPSFSSLSKDTSALTDKKIATAANSYAKSKVPTKYGTI